MIYHMLLLSAWQRQPVDQPYKGDTLASEGFIHCTGEIDRLALVANRFYRHQPGEFVILGINPAQVQAEIKWELADQHSFPHIYGSLNLDAVVDVIKFPRDVDGQFLQPIELQRT